MKKIGVVTFHHAKHSYGAALQALATLRGIKKLGYDAELINYENAFEQKEVHYEGLSLVRKCALFANWFARMFFFGSITDPCRKGKNLDKMYKDVTTKVYRSPEELEQTDYDVLVSGSDQIWNPEITGGVDAAYLLQFGNPKKRIAYASSMGSYRLTAEEVPVYRKALSRFNAIGVRENYAKEQLQPLCEKEIKVVCDPTLLLTGDEWRAEFAQQISALKPETPYILTYFVGGNIDSYWPQIAEIVEQYGLPVWNVQSHGKKYAHTAKAVYAITPGDLVAHIEKAALVITDSFHGTAFSVNLGAPFAAVLNPKNPVRVKDLLEKVGLQERIHMTAANCEDPIDYIAAHEKLEKFRKDSAQWLKDALQDNV